MIGTRPTRAALSAYRARCLCLSELEREHGGVDDLVGVDAGRVVEIGSRLPDWPNSSTPSGTTGTPQTEPRKASECDAPSWIVTIGARRSLDRDQRFEMTEIERRARPAPAACAGRCARSSKSRFGAGHIDHVRRDAFLVQPLRGLDRLRHHDPADGDLDHVAWTGDPARQICGR